MKMDEVDLGLKLYGIEWGGKWVFVDLLLLLEVIELSLGFE